MSPEHRKINGASIPPHRFKKSLRQIHTEYCPTDASILKASELREKTDKSVPLAPSEGGQFCPERRSDVSSEGGQIGPPNLEKEKKEKT
ncbi:hypothetical protein ROS1_60020 [Roseibium sp. ROS1]